MKAKVCMFYRMNMSIPAHCSIIDKAYKGFSFFFLFKKEKRTNPLLQRCLTGVVGFWPLMAVLCILYFYLNNSAAIPSASSLPLRVNIKWLFT